MRTINIKRHAKSSKYGGFWESLGFGTSITPNSLRWNISAGDHDDNGESLRIVMDEVHKYWATEDSTSNTAWWSADTTNYPNTVTGADTNNWPWSKVETQLARIQTELAKSLASSPSTVQHFNTMMDQNAVTKKFMIVDPELQAAPVNADGVVDPVTDHGSGVLPSQVSTSPYRSLIIGGGVVLGVSLIAVIVMAVKNSMNKTPKLRNRY